MSLFRKKSYATEQKAVSTSAVSLTTALVDNTANYPSFKASGALIEVRSNAIYYTVDGSTPSSTNGIGVVAGQYIELEGYQNVKKFQAIRQTADGTLNVQFFSQN
jgi:hypothetical protein